MVKWKAEVANRGIYGGTTEDGSWRQFKATLGDGHVIWVSLELEGVAGAAIDPFRDGYFLGNKVITSMSGNESIYLVGLGYWNRDEDTARIKWYNADNMQLMFTEARPTKECGFFLIQNPSKSNQ